MDVLPYVLVISITVLLLYFAEKFYSKSRTLFVVLSVFALVVPSLMAAFRDRTVGVDVRVYEEFCFRVCKASHSLGEAIHTADLDAIFVAINYFASCISPDIHLAFFCIEFFILFFSFVACVRFRDCGPIWAMMLVFLLCYYNLTFNLMRQMVALSLLLVAVSYLHRDRSFGKFFLVLGVCAFAHKTSVMAGMFFVAIYFISERPRQSRLAWSVLYSVGCVGVVVIFKLLLDFLSQLGPGFAHYVAYGGDVSAKAFKPTLLTILILGDVLLLAFAFVISRFVKASDENSNRLLLLLVLFVITDLMSEFLGLYTGFASRMSCYFCAAYLFLLPSIARSTVLSKKSAYLCQSVILLLYFVIWLRMLPMTGYTIPYKSSILGI